MAFERNKISTECYNLAYTQHLKNKDIPEGGSKAVIFLKPFEQLEAEAKILSDELEDAKVSESDINNKLALFRRDQKEEYLLHTQRSFIESLLTLINTDALGNISAKYIVDYWQRPEYIYLGPDEYMSDSMIEWIAAFAQKYHYIPGNAFITSKPLVGINHKHYGVTSRGVNVYMAEVLRYLGIDPDSYHFTVKMSGGPDGDVAGNQILNLHRHYANTAKLLALTTFLVPSMTLKASTSLSWQIYFSKQNPSAFIHPKDSTKAASYWIRIPRGIRQLYIQQTLCWGKKEEQLVKDWLSTSDMNYLLRHNVHSIKADVFLPCGGRPRTLNDVNYKDFLDETGKPTSRAIIEGANLYLTNVARHQLEELGSLIAKDSSANKGGVICSSYEVMCSLALTDDEFIMHKEQLVAEVLDRLQVAALNEAQLLLRTHSEEGMALSEASDRISQRINYYTYQLLDYLDTIPLENTHNSSLIRCFLAYCLPLLRQEFEDRLMSQIPEHHKKAMIAPVIWPHNSSTIKKGLDWTPSVVEIFHSFYRTMSSYTIKEQLLNWLGYQNAVFESPIHHFFFSISRTMGVIGSFLQDIIP